MSTLMRTQHRSQQREKNACCGNGIENFVELLQSCCYRRVEEWIHWIGVKRFGPVFSRAPQRRRRLPEAGPPNRLRGGRRAGVEESEGAMLHAGSLSKSRIPALSAALQCQRFGCFNQAVEQRRLPLHSRQRAAG